jgi:two-component system, NarL family, nitrate/nitrite response regulator NarL
MTGSGTVRVFVADDHPLFREALSRAVSDHPELELAGSADNGRDALSEIERLEPDVAILDIRMPAFGGAKVAESLRSSAESTKVLLLSAHVEGEIVSEAAKVGAAGCLAKDAGSKEVCEAALTAAKGGKVFPSHGAFGPAEQTGVQRSGDNPLAGQELRALRLAAEGLSNREIASRLVVSPGAIKSYLRRAYEKLEAPDRGSAIAEAMRRGLIT